MFGTDAAFFILSPRGLSSAPSYFYFFILTNKTKKSNMKTMKYIPFKIDGLEYVSLCEAARIIGVRNDRFGKILKILVPNGLRIYNTSKNNKGIRICLDDIVKMQRKAVELQISITEIELV